MRLEALHGPFAAAAFRALHLHELPDTDAGQAAVWPVLMALNTEGTSSLPHQNSRNVLMGGRQVMTKTEINPYYTEAHAEADTFTSDILMSPPSCHAM